jgi:hypothetical protein
MAEHWVRVTLKSGRVVEIDEDALEYLVTQGKDGEEAGVRLIKDAFKPVPEADAIKCVRCGESIRLTSYNGSRIWEHLTPPSERHGPWPRTHCEMGPKHNCKGCDNHAAPDTPAVSESLDRWFLEQVGICLGEEEKL